MIVKVKTNFCGQPELDILMPTLKKVLLELSKTIKFPVLDRTNGRIHSDFKVYLNGVEREDLYRGVDPELKNEDNVEVTLVILAGG